MKFVLYAESTLLKKTTVLRSAPFAAGKMMLFKGKMPDYPEGANGMSLNEYRRRYAEYLKESK